MKLVIDNVSKNFIDPQGKQLSVLEHVSLAVHSEEFVALVGPSGCGKSTLLNLTAGLLSPTDGSIYFTDLAEGHTPAMGIVFQGNRPVSLAQCLRQHRLWTWKLPASQKPNKKNESSITSVWSGSAALKNPFPISCQAACAKELVSPGFGHQPRPAFDG